MAVPNNRTLEILRKAEEGGCKCPRSSPLEAKAELTILDGVIAQSWYDSHIEDCDEGG